MKEVFYRLRDTGVLEQVPNRSQAKKAWQKKSGAGVLDVEG